jgi:hypothetical protein
MFTARQLLLQETDVIRLSFITSAVYAFACALTGVMWREWVVTGGGNANFVFGVRFVFMNFSHACASSLSSLLFQLCHVFGEFVSDPSSLQCSAARHACRSHTLLQTLLAHRRWLRSNKSKAADKKEHTD